MAFCLIALGANLGDRQVTLACAVESLTASGEFAVVSQSTWHETAAVGGPADQSTYLNGALLVETALSPMAVMAALEQVEQALGRTREVRWGARTIDLDLLLYDDLVINTPTLIVPHPRMAFRRFVVEPAAEAVPKMRHPQIGWTMRELCQHLREAPNYVAITGAPGTGKAELARGLAARQGWEIIADPRDALNAVGGADSAGRIFETEIELLSQRRALLTLGELDRSWPAAVSDFWLEQSLAFSSRWSDAQCRRKFADIVQAAVQTRAVVRPKLLVLLTPQTVNDRNADSCAGQAEIAAELVAMAQRPGVGPLLRLAESDPATNLAELVAAVTAMQ